MQSGEKYEISLIKCVFIRAYYIHDETIKEIKQNNVISNNNICEILIKLLDYTVSYFNFIMIDNSISDPTKQIWINLKLYFKSYEFSNF